jgi:hypothetical protein
MPARADLQAFYHRTVRPGGDGHLGSHFGREISAQMKERNGTGSGPGARERRSEQWGYTILSFRSFLSVSHLLSFISQR